MISATVAIEYESTLSKAGEKASEVYDVLEELCASIDYIKIGSNKHSSRKNVFYNVKFDENNFLNVPELRKTLRRAVEDIDEVQLQGEGIIFEE